MESPKSNVIVDNLSAAAVSDLVRHVSMGDLANWASQHAKDCVLVMI